jgi:hypothetical protein
MSYVIQDPTYKGGFNPFVFVKDFRGGYYDRAHFSNARKFKTEAEAIYYIVNVEQSQGRKLTRSDASKKFVMLLDGLSKMPASSKNKAKEHVSHNNCLFVSNGSKTDVYGLVDGEVKIIDRLPKPVYTYIDQSIFWVITIIYENKLVSGYIENKDSGIGKLAVSISLRDGVDYIPELEKQNALNKFFSVESYTKLIETPRNAVFYLLDYSNLSEGLTEKEIFRHVVSVVAKALKTKIQTIPENCLLFEVGNLNVVISADSTDILIVDRDIYDALHTHFN